MSLFSQFLNHQGRAIQKWKHYFPVYESHFARYAGRPVTVFEIGCGEGGSLQLWKQYFGPLAQVVGIDIREICTEYEEDQIAVRIGHQSNRQFLDSVLAEFGPPDIVIDDGSHIMNDITETFLHLYPRMSATGVYLVEDLHTAYWPEFGGGLGKPGNFIEFSKSLIDQMNAEWTRGALKVSAFTTETLSMHFHNSMVVFERGRTPLKIAPIIPRQTPEGYQPPETSFAVLTPPPLTQMD
jgi:SAM-dependent methyltransferase